MNNRTLTPGLIRAAIASACAAASASAAAAAAAPTALPLTEAPDPSLRAIGLGLAAALAVGISVVGASLAIGRIGAAALGAAAEKPELLTRSLLFMALAEGLGVLGFAIAILILQKIG